MASVDDLWSGPRRTSIPKPLLCSVPPSMRPRNGSSSREASAPGLLMPVLCARSWRGASSIWRNGASGIKQSLPTARFVFLLRTIDLSANAGKVRREWLSRR